MRWDALALAIAALLATAAGGFALESTGEGGDARLGDPTCTSLTDGDVFIRGALGDRFTPSCVAVENGQTVTWHNEDGTAHNPGDGELHDPDADCFKASADQGGYLEPSETYAIQLAFDEDAEQLQSFHENRGWIDCPDDVWSWTDGDEEAIEIPYLCHRHTDGEARIVVQL